MDIFTTLEDAEEPKLTFFFCIKILRNYVISLQGTAERPSEVQTNSPRTRSVLLHSTNINVTRSMKRITKLVIMEGHNSAI